jgi:NADPH:quinone reductase-like Zn-dependent oxidoreductase
MSTPTSMNALVYSSYGDASVLSVKQIPTPVPGPNEVLVRVAATSVNKGDQVILGGTPFMVRLATGHLVKPSPDTVIGSDFAGTVHAVGAAVTKFNVGEEVYGQVNFTTGRGSFAEFVCMSESDTMWLKPTNLSFAEAAALPCAGQTALQTVRDDGGVKAGSKVVINGASGGVGSFAVQVAKALGAHVTAVCSKANAGAARELGADVVVDYGSEDFVEKYQGQADVHMDYVGSRSMRDNLKALAKHGTYVTAGGPPETFMGRVACFMALKPFASQTMVLGMLKPSQHLLESLKDLAEAGQLTPRVAAKFDLAHAADAFRLFEQGHVQGKIVVTMP